MQYNNYNNNNNYNYNNNYINNNNFYMKRRNFSSSNRKKNLEFMTPENPLYGLKKKIDLLEKIIKEANANTKENNNY